MIMKKCKAKGFNEGVAAMDLKAGEVRVTVLFGETPTDSRFRNIAPLPERLECDNNTKRRFTAIIKE